ncbi:MAG: hypothetical protein GY930_17135 [bacterium]|nr:hypothetical protein [bacterium]
MTKKQHAVHKMRRRTLDINRAFLKMRPLFVGARRLSLNAEVTSSVVGKSGEGLIVVMRELRTMTNYLRDMIVEIDAVSARVATRMATCMSAESMQLYYRHTLDLMRVDQGKPKLIWPDSFQGARTRPMDLNPSESMVWNGLCKADASIFASMATLAGISQELLVLLNRSGWVAVRQSEYLAVLAAVEASRWTERRESVEAIVDSMREISAELRIIQKDAGVQVNGLIDEIKRVQGPASTTTKSIAA